MPRSSSSATLARGLVFGLVCGLGACGAGADSPNRPLPTYEGRSVDLFDDAIDPRAVGLNLDNTRTPQTDPIVRERTQVADAVVRVKVQTVTKKEGEDIQFQLGLQVLEKLGGAHELPETFVVRIDKSSSSIGILKSLDSRIGGKTFVAFVREFKGGDGEPRYYAHFSADSKDVIAAVKDAMALQEFK
jgi:hypothetical protein